MGYRLVPESRGSGTRPRQAKHSLPALVRRLGRTACDDRPRQNHASQRSAGKLGFTLLKQAFVDGDVTNLYMLAIGDSGR